MNNQRTIEEIKSYLMIHSRDLTDVDTIIKQAQKWEKEYETELNHHIYEYALLSDSRVFSHLSTYSFIRSS